MYRERKSTGSFKYVAEVADVHQRVFNTLIEAHLSNNDVVFIPRMLNRALGLSNEYWMKGSIPGAPDPHGRVQPDSIIIQFWEGRYNIIPHIAFNLNITSEDIKLCIHENLANTRPDIFEDLKNLDIKGDCIKGHTIEDKLKYIITMLWPAIDAVVKKYDTPQEFNSTGYLGALSIDKFNKNMRYLACSTNNQILQSMVF